MIKKALLTVMAAGALSVPLAGVAWADQPDPNGDPNGEGIGPGGVPGKIGRRVDPQGETTDGHIPRERAKIPTSSATVTSQSCLAPSWTF